jgi:FkbM family methyltransferase
MIPTLDALQTIAAGVLQRLPDGLTHGKVAATLYGLGFVGRCALPRLREGGVRLVCGYDANEALQGQCLDGLPVRAPADLHSRRPGFVVITARHAVRAISAMLEELDIPHVSYDAWQAAAAFAEFCDVHDRLLCDDRSQQALRAVLAAMLTGDADYCEAVWEGDQYLCLPRFREGCDEHFVDAGAFDGDSAENFLRIRAGRFAKLYAFEPGVVQFAALQARAMRWIQDWRIDPARIELINAALGEGNHSVRLISANGQLTNLAACGASGGNGGMVNVVSLDCFLADRPVTFLKADVEGMEMDLLRGASAVIRRHQPKLAVCAYHHPTDILDIVNSVYALVPQYRVALRHHSPCLMETVLYFWID